MTEKLFTPGPLTTSADVKEAMLRDVGSRDGRFCDLVRRIRRELPRLGGARDEDPFETVLFPGSGTHSIEAVVSSVVPAEGKLLVLANGAYGERIARIAEVHRIPLAVVRSPENTPIDPGAVSAALAEDPAISHVALVHCETTTGLLNPLEEVGRAVAAEGRIFIVDAMSSFGGIPVDLPTARIDYLVSSSNKCIEGVPGFSFVLARREALLAAEGAARTVSLDLLDQWRGLERDEQFRFTPPTHAILAFGRALDALDAEGGIAARAARYRENQRLLAAGMARLGFRAYLAESVQSAIITTFHDPTDPAYDFEPFYSGLKRRGCVIYPGKVARVDSFRIGTIGQIFPGDIELLLGAIETTLGEMGVTLPLPGPPDPA